MWAAGTGDEKIYWHGKADGRRAVSLLLRIGFGRLEMTGAVARVVPARTPRSRHHDQVAARKQGVHDVEQFDGRTCVGGQAQEVKR